jgi:hypothetical protein
MLSRKKFLSLLVAVLAIAAWPLASRAIPLNEVQNVANNSGLANYTTAGEVMLAVLRALLATAFLVALIFMVVSGYRMIVSAGNAEQVEAAKKNLYWTIGGIVVIVLAWVLLAIVVNLLRTGQA